MKKRELIFKVKFSLPLPSSVLKLPTELESDGDPAGGGGGGGVLPYKGKFFGIFSLLVFLSVSFLGR